MKFISVSGQAHMKFCSVSVLIFLLFEGIKAIYLPCVGVGWISLGRAHFFFLLSFLKPFSSKAQWRTNLGEVPPSFIQLKSEENWDSWVYPDLAEEWFHLLGVFQDFCPLLAPRFGIEQGPVLGHHPLTAGEPRKELFCPRLESKSRLKTGIRPSLNTT